MAHGVPGTIGALGYASGSYNRYQYTLFAIVKVCNIVRTCLILSGYVGITHRVRNVNLLKLRFSLHLRKFTRKHDYERAR